jgi:hypothetical protein
MTKMIVLEGTGETIMVSGKQGVVVPRAAKIKPSSLYQWFWNIIHEGVEKKYCQKCKQWLPVSEFSKGKTTHDGFSCYCKPCSTKWDRSQTIPRWIKIGIPIPQGADVLSIPHVMSTPHIIHDGIEKKYCGHCKQWLPTAKFCGSKTTPDKLNHLCKEYYREKYKKREARRRSHENNHAIK